MIYKANGDIYRPVEAYVPLIWSRKLLDRFKDHFDYEAMQRVSELRKSCGVVPGGSDKIKIGKRRMA